jgi:AcrR family transcriptional regulator
MLGVSMEIPRTLKILWGLESRGRQGGLSLGRIVAAAIEIADAEGLDALSMSRLAQRLGSAPMSLYRHVASKDELLVFMQDAAPGPPPELPGGWRDGLAAWARALRGVYDAHPWILRVTAARPPLDPGQLAWLDRGLSALGGTPLPARDRLDAIMTLLCYVRGEAHIATVLLGEEQDDSYGTLLARFVRPERFPALAAAIAEGGFAPEPAGSRSFEAGLAAILDGLQLSIER